MIDNKRVLAIVPARSGSKGLPGKNIRPFCGKPLLQWSVEHGLSSRHVDRVIVSTDSSEFADIARKSGALVPFLRPAHLSSDTAKSADVVLHAVDFLEERGDIFDVLVLLEPTSPLRSPEDIDRAVELLVAGPDAESVVSISRVEAHHPSFLMRKNEAGFIEPYLSDFRVVRRQDITQLYFLDGTVYASLVSSFRARKGFYHEKTVGYEVPKYKSFEIDDLDDFIICEALFRSRQT